MFKNQSIDIINPAFRIYAWYAIGGQVSPSDPFFIEKLRDVVGLYLSPPQNALVICVDEKSQCQALERTQPMLPMGFPSASEYLSPL